MKICNVVGPPGSDKSSRAFEIAKHLGCNEIVDNIKPDDYILFLSQQKIEPIHTYYYTIEDTLRVLEKNREEKEIHIDDLVQEIHGFWEHPRRVLKVYYSALNNTMVCTTYNPKLMKLEDTIQSLLRKVKEK